MESNNDLNVQIDINKMSEREIKAFQKLLSKFMKSYKEKDDSVNDKEWLKKEFVQELESITNEEAEKLSIDTINSIKEFDENLKSINDSYKNGSNKEKWFEDKVSEASIGMAVNDFGNYLSSIDKAITDGNAQMIRTVTTKSGDISKCYNLDGFIAEQYHVNNFNMKATLENSNYRAEVCVPEAGQTYGLNSFDTVIKDIKTGRIVHQYQFKFGKDADATISLLNHGNYNNQRFVVPLEQVDKVQEAFPGKSVETYIGGTEKVSIRTEGLTKDDVKELQLNTQKENNIPLNSWDNYSTNQLVKNIGKNATLSGLQCVAVTAGFDIVNKIITGQEVDADETIEIALKTGTDTGIKTVTAGALKVAVEKGIITIIPKGTPAGVIANLACISIENVKILIKVANGEITILEALDMIGRTSMSMIYGIGWGTAGAGIGIAVLSWIPIVGPIVGGIVGGMIGYMAGSKVGSLIYSGIKKVWSTAKKVVSTAWEGIKSVGRNIGNGIKNTASKVASFLGW